MDHTIWACTTPCELGVMNRTIWACTTPWVLPVNKQPTGFHCHRVTSLFFVLNVIFPSFFFSLLAMNQSRDFALTFFRVPNCSCSTSSIFRPKLACSQAPRSVVIPQLVLVLSSCRFFDLFYFFITKG